MEKAKFARVLITEKHEMAWGEDYSSRAVVGYYDELKSYANKVSTEVEEIRFESSDDTAFLMKSLKEGFQTLKEIWCYISLSNGFEACGDLPLVIRAWRDAYPYAATECFYIFDNKEQMEAFNQHFRATLLVDNHLITT